MKKILSVFLLVPFFCFSQNIGPRPSVNNPSSSGISFSQNTSFSKNRAWIGSEVSLSSKYKPSSLEGPSFYTELLVFGWSRQISGFESLNSYDFSLLRIGSPITVSILKFGALDFNHSLFWYYKPEVGIGFGNFEVFYSYNAFFNKVPNDVHEKHMLNFRFSKQISSLFLFKNIKSF